MCPDSYLAPLEDGALARRVAEAGAATPDSAAETELYRRLAPRVRLYGLRHLRDPHAAADLVQQVLLLTLERLRAGKVREPERIASFVLGTCRMTVLEMRRGTRRREALLETWGNASEAFEAPEQFTLAQDRMAACLEALSERERSIVVLSFFADKQADEVGAELAISAGNVRVIRHRAIARLRACIGAGEEQLMTCNHPIDLETFIAYWLGEVAEEREAALEDHWFGCVQCSRRLEGLTALASGVRTVVHDGTVTVLVSAPFVEAMRQAGLRLREYRLEPGGSVNCTIRADDDAVISRLRTPLTGVKRLDVVRSLGDDGPKARVADVPFDAETGEVLILPSAAWLKTMPAFTMRMQLIAVDATGDKQIGDYTFNHAPS